MPLYIPDDPVIVLFELLGTIFASISYGIVIVLSGNSFHLFQKKRGIYSNPVRILLIIYVILMLQLSTWTLMRLIWCIIIYWVDILFRESIPGLALHIFSIRTSFHHLGGR